MRIKIIFFILFTTFYIKGQSIFDKQLGDQNIDSTYFNDSTKICKLYWSDDFAMRFQFKIDKSQNAFLFCPIQNKVFSFNLNDQQMDYLSIDPYVSINSGCEKLYNNFGSNILPVRINGNQDEFKGRILVLVDSTLYLDIVSEIGELKLDLIGEGYRVDILKIPHSMKNYEVKSKIIEYRNSNPDLSSLYLLGDIPFAESGNYKLDGHDDHWGAQLADYYYSDLDGIWTDTLNYPPAVPNSSFINIPNDGKFDQSKMPSAPDLEIGRAFFSNLPIFSENEVTLTKRYLNKVHQHRTKRQNYDYLFYQGMTHTGFNHLSTFYYDFKSKPTDVLSNDTIFKLNNKNALVGISNNTGGPSILYNGFSSNDLLTKDINVKFMFLFGSYFFDLRYQNNLIRSLLASNSPTVSAYWVSNKNVGMTLAANGYTIGKATISLYDEPKLENNTPSNFYTGDPSIKLRILDQIENFQISNEKNKVQLSWDKHGDEKIEGYKIYRSNQLDGEYKLITPIALKNNSYTDFVNQIGEYYYMVRAFKKEYSRSSSFWNYSTGKIKSIVIDEVSEIKNTYITSNYIYPNPTNSKICISNHENINLITIYDIYGKKCNQYTLSDVCIDISTLPNGIYLLNILNDKGITENYHFVKM